MVVEAAVSLLAAWRARSPALLAFGGDSAIELLSAVVVLWRFRANAPQEHIERRAARIAGVLLFVLAAYVVAAVAMALLGYSEPKPTLLGIVVLIAAAVVMPWLAKEKRRLSASTGSAALRADAAESALCAYLSVIALAGLAVNAIWWVAWADSVAALVIVPLILWGGAKPFAAKRVAVADPHPRIDEFLPNHDFTASYEIRINAPTSVVYQCLLHSDFSEPWLVRLLMTVRSGRSRRAVLCRATCASGSKARALSSWRKFRTKNLSSALQGDSGVPMAGDVST
jgi:hypothetical protein